MNTKKHIIFKGFRRPWPFRIIGLQSQEDYMMRKSFTFTESCRYDLNSDDQYDWNKLYGASFGLFGIHKNSVRFVWRYNKTTDKIDIAAYWYLNGERCWYELCSVEIGKRFNFKITFLKNSTVFSPDVVFTVLDDYVPIAKYYLSIDEKTFEKDRYCCGIYFGGNRRAPQRIEIIEHLDV